MKILVVGSGGREHALVWKIAQSPLAGEILAAPGNAGTATLARNVAVAADDIKGLVRLAADERVDLTVVGPEVPLTMGLADRLTDAGLPVFGPSAAGARIEGSKWFAKELMQKGGIPTAAAHLANTREDALSRADELGYPVVIKADGLAAGKGVVIAQSAAEAETAVDDMLVRGRFGASGKRVLIEECLKGEEASILAFVDGERSALMVPSQDHKRAFDGDEGPNTGGMGAYAPVADGTAELVERARLEVADPILRGMAERGYPYRGFLYAGLMLTPEGLKVVEFNCRLGDPEAQVVLPLTAAGLAEPMAAIARGESIAGWTAGATHGAALVTVVVSGGYPGPYPKGVPIETPPDLESENVHVYHAGTALEDGRLVTAGGRVVGVTGLGDDLAEAAAQSREAAAQVWFDGAAWRSDIGHSEIEPSAG